MDGVRCFYFDSIGAPSAEGRERDFSGGEQQRMTLDEARFLIW